MPNNKNIENPIDPTLLRISREYSETELGLSTTDPCQTINKNIEHDD